MKYIEVKDLKVDDKVLIYLRPTAKEKIDDDLADYVGIGTVTFDDVFGYTEDLAYIATPPFIREPSNWGISTRDQCYILTDAEYLLLVMAETV